MSGLVEGVWQTEPGAAVGDDWAVGGGGGGAGGEQQTAEHPAVGAGNTFLKCAVR